MRPPVCRVTERHGAAKAGLELVPVYPHFACRRLLAFDPKRSKEVSALSPVGTRGAGIPRTVFKVIPLPRETRRVLFPADQKPTHLCSRPKRLILYKQPSDTCRVMLGSLLRVIRSVARHDRRALKEEAERNPDGLARWAHATESWMHGEIAAARRSAEIDLQTRPDDFDLIRICLDYHIRARDSAQIYIYAKRLLAARNPAALLRRIYAAESMILWPLWLLGYKGGRGVKKGADNCDRWVAWARDLCGETFCAVHLD